MKVLLLKPFSAKYVFGEKLKEAVPSSSPPLGIAYIASYLEREGFEVRLCDTDAEGMGPEEFRALVRDVSPDLIGITSMTANFKGALEAARIAKEVSEAPVVIGGPHASVLGGEILLKYPSFDIVAHGEGEETMLEIARGNPLREVYGITYRYKGTPVTTEPRPRLREIDSLPFPAYDQIDMDGYGDPLWNLYGDRVASVITSRGCPFDCTFCASKTIFGRKVVYRSVENVMEEVRLLVRDYGVDCVSFVDDTFTLKRDRTLAFCRELEKVGVPWVCNLRVDTVDYEILAAMKRAGCRLVHIGVESGDPAVLKTIKKALKVEDVERAMRWINKLGIDSQPGFIIGLPGSTGESIMRTLRFARKINSTFPLFYTLTPYPGTEVYTYAVQNDLLLFNEWTELIAPKYEKPAMRHPLFDERELKRFQKKAYRMAYFRPKYALTQILPKLRNPRMVAHYWDLFLKFMRNLPF